jgi:hypothetical protein
MSEYPEVKGNVRAKTHLTGYYVIEIEPNICEVHFFIEADMKISAFIAKQTVPKSSNYAFFLREYIDKQN